MALTWLFRSDTLNHQPSCPIPLVSEGQHGGPGDRPGGVAHRRGAPSGQSPVVTPVWRPAYLRLHSFDPGTNQADLLLVRCCSHDGDLKRWIEQDNG
jgi:hypothetical protein